MEEESLGDNAVADFIINLLFAGNETTAKTMLFAVYFLTHSPRAMKQLLVITFIHFTITLPGGVCFFGFLFKAICFNI